MAYDGTPRPRGQAHVAPATLGAATTALGGDGDGNGDGDGDGDVRTTHHALMADGTTQQHYCGGGSGRGSKRVAVLLLTTTARTKVLCCLLYPLNLALLANACLLLTATAVPVAGPAQGPRVNKGHSPCGVCAVVVLG